MPVCERTYCASNAACSVVAALELSVTENSQQQKNDSGMVKRAGDTKGNKAEPFGYPNTASHTPGLTTFSTRALKRPTNPPITAPRVVSPFHMIESSNTGKLALAATANARP